MGADPETKLALLRSDARTSIACLAAWGVPSTRKWPLLGSLVESQNSYLAMVSPWSGSDAVNRVEAATVVLSARLRSPAFTIGAWSIGAVTWKLCQVPQSWPSKARTHNWAEPDPLWNVVCAN